MATIKPFRGVRYNTAAAGDIDKLVCPPYDVISPEEQNALYDADVHNFVRLVLGKDDPDDNEENNRFARARDYIVNWMHTGIFIQDEVPTIYLYLQEFKVGGETKRVLGFTCAVKICDYDEKVILPHENTLAKPKSQLLNLISATESNLDCVYGLYDDEKYVLKPVMDKAMATEPIVDARDGDGERHVLWAITDPADIKVMVDFMATKPIAIADGHHRYETSLTYRNLMREKSQPGTPLPSDDVMMTLVNVYEKDMTIYPTHRAVGSVTPEDIDKMLDECGDFFALEPSAKETLEADMAKKGAIGLYTKDKCVLLIPKEKAYRKLSGCEASRTLELNVLHKHLLERSLGIDGDKLRNQTHILYTRDIKEAFDLVDSGERTASFLVNPIPVKVVLDIAEAGEKMPQKATYFYPKLLSGLVFRIHNAPKGR
ncbi:MAG: DUF1015 domain-containing protein [Abditibacteriota bacterium]|nr:DUF1015 domain-containing protein [Abditibacteriota bacterium]